MGAKTTAFLVILVLASAAACHQSSAASQLVLADGPPSSDQGVYPIALRYKKQLLERIEAPVASCIGLRPADLNPLAFDPGPQLPATASLALSGTDLHYVLMSIQQ
jgi:hypothetical protein